MKRGAFLTAFGRMLLWMLSILLLIHLITGLSPEQNGAPVVPDWAEFVVWALFIVPIVPAMIAGVARIRGRETWKPILLGVVFGLLTPFLGVFSLAATFLMIGGNVDLGPHDERVSELLILVTLFSTVIALGVGTALIRHNASKL